MMYDGDEYEELPDYPDDETDCPDARQYPVPPTRHRFPPRQAGETIGNVLQSLTEYARSLEHEKSSRSEIERKRNAALSVIHSERRVMLEYLGHRFGERESLYRQYFKLIDSALELQNDEIVRIAVESILSVYQDSPCAGLDEFRQQFAAISEAVRI